MRFPTPLLKATLIKRYKRFLADVRLETGEIITATCPNTGTLLGMTDAGLTIYLSKSESLTRKYAHTWHITDKPGVGLVGIDTSLPNRITEEAITARFIPELAGYDRLRREVKYGENSRIDLLLEDEGRPPCFVEVKSGWVKLNELDIADDGASAPGHGDAISGGDIGVRRFLVNAAKPARGEEYGAGVDGVVLSIARVIGDGAADFAFRH